MNYKATIDITVFGAEAVDEFFLATVKDRIFDYLSFDGEHVMVEVSIENEETPDSQ
jgi:hypothetical protein